jgi:hypothetical protein
MNNLHAAPTSGEVRSKEEILKTLDKAGRLEGLPLMPQKFPYCHQQFKVFKVKRAHRKSPS